MMNLRLMWAAVKFSVVTGGILFTAGLIAERPRLVDAAFNPFVQVGAFAVGLAACKIWDIR